MNKRIKTTSLVSAKIIMCLSADTISVPAEQRMAHKNEVAKDDFGLGTQDRCMYSYMTTAFAATDCWWWGATQSGKNAMSFLITTPSSKNV